MSKLSLALFIVFATLRLITLAISVKNERQLRQSGAEEYDPLNTKILAALHALFYLAALAEGWLKGVQFDGVALTGAIIYLLAMAVLFYIIRVLSPIWTVKLYIAKGHTLNKSWLFSHVRHPNYFLNIIPELIGLALVLKAYWVLLTIFPLYLISLALRIVREEKIMRATFSDY
ncbi:isoprenylcysteine carboxylmethyltransferase family protein [Halioxenophilus sp. WMMB6]|uniref:isoprenylcysteine carboxylmethyltransferase family protein n=1 Tax=Halioxenophilus sp. WMMB6 TaxID=3073815 RepID=UPI00295F2531|nr:isoprenylcysteine carboxylmethyltransferase family protein [Halioxenophilus sp. WMMB6]